MQQVIQSFIDIRTILNDISDGSINLKPPYQRDFIWNDKNQYKFIDSIFNNYFIPPFIFNNNSNSNYELDCVDGQQRLSTIANFYGLTYYKDNSSNIDIKIGNGDILNVPKCYFPIKYHDILEDKSYNYNTLPTCLKKIFNKKILIRVDLINHTDIQIYETFRRIQLGIQAEPEDRIKALLEYPIIYVIKKSNVFFNIQNELFKKENNRKKNKPITKSKNKNKFFIFGLDLIFILKNNNFDIFDYNSNNSKLELLEQNIKSDDAVENYNIKTDSLNNKINIYNKLCNKYFHFMKIFIKFINKHKNIKSNFDDIDCFIIIYIFNNISINLIDIIKFYYDNYSIKKKHFINKKFKSIKFKLLSEELINKLSPSVEEINEK